MADIFISYKQEDRALVAVLADALEARGWDVWWDPDIRDGEDFRSVIAEALDQTGCVIVAWSQRSVKSRWVLDEAERGLQRKVLFPVKIEEGVETPLGFGGTQTADLSTWMKDRTQAAAFERLCDAIAAKIGRPKPRSPGDEKGEQKTVVVPLVKRDPDWRIAGRPPWQIISASLLAAALLAAAAVYALKNVGGPPLNGNSAATASPAPTGGQIANVATSPGSSAQETPTPRALTPADEAAAAAPLKDLRCVLPSETRNPILERVAAASPVPFKVDAAQHILLDKEDRPVPVVAAANLGGKLESPRLIVAHFSGAPSADATAKYFEQGGASKASVHVLIARDGTVRQFVPFDYAANHAGTGRWNGLSNLNRHSIAIDLENWGRLERGGDGWKAFGRRVPDGEVAVVGEAKDGWHKYTDAQVRAFFQVACALRRAYPTIEDVAGHDEVNKVRTDPGPAFPIGELRRTLIPTKRLPADDAQQ